MAEARYKCPRCGCTTAKRMVYSPVSISVHRCTKCRKLNNLEIRGYTVFMPRVTSAWKNKMEAN